MQTYPEQSEKKSEKPRKYSKETISIYFYHFLSNQILSSEVKFVTEAAGCLLIFVQKYSQYNNEIVSKGHDI